MQLIETSFAFAIIASLSGCVTGQQPAEIPGCRTMDCAALGEPQEAGRYEGDLVMTPLEVIEDSRCPIEAECVWEGRVLLKSELRMGHEIITVELTTEEALRINGGMLSIAEVAPEQSVEWSPIPSENYRFGFRFAPDIMEPPAPKS